MQQVARREGNVLVWVGEGEAESTASSIPAASNTTASPAAAPPAPDSGERRQLTVMFCDLVGSTELAQRIDPEELREIVREYRSVCGEATKRFEGHVAQYLGDGVMVYFGWPQAHELGDEALALGPTSNLAARIEGVAKPETVVVSDATLALCRGVFVTQILGETELKGVDAPVLLHEIERSVGRAGRPRPGGARLAATLCGRTREKNYRVDACVARARVRLELGDGAPAETERWLLEGLEAADAADNLQAQLIISTHLAHLAPRTGKLREAHDRLARCYARLTCPAREAKAALDELAARPRRGNPGQRALRERDGIAGQSSSFSR